MNLIACLDGGGEGGVVEGSRVVLAKNKLILICTKFTLIPLNSNRL